MSFTQFKSRASVWDIGHKRWIKRLTTEQTSSNLYDVLGVTSRATHREIKAAYYKLSMTYHPDKNKNSEMASQKFREITQAYEILGNFANRRKYDRGIATIDISNNAYRREPEANTQAESFFRSRTFRSHAPPPSGRTPIYDFDAWTESHYKDILQRNKVSRQFKETHNVDNSPLHWKIEYLKLLVMCLIAFVCAIYFTQPYDLTRTKKHTDKKE